MKVLIRTDSVFTGVPGEGQVDRKGILIEDGKIVKLLDGAEGEPPADKVIDGRGLFVMPGLIDLHVHLSSPAGANLASSLVEKTEYGALRASKFAGESLMAGFTTLRDLGSNGYQIIALKEAIRDGLVKGPRIIAAGRPLTETGGHADSPFSNGRVSDGEVEVRRAVREQIKNGADVIKIHTSGGGTSPHDDPSEPQFTVPEIQSIVEEAHSKFRKVAAHAQSNAGIRNAAAAKVDTIEHALFMDDVACNLIKNNGLTIVPTMVSPLMTSKYGKDAGVPEWAVRKATEALEPHAASVRLARKNGLKIAFGTDAGTPFNFHGNNGKEFECLVELGGLEPVEALYAATGIAGDALGDKYQVGKIAVGHEADIILVEGDPTEDIGVMTKPESIRHVLLKGEEAKD